MTREIIQEEAYQAIIKNDGNGMLVMATGSGKSYIAIRYMDYIYKQNPTCTIYICVPTTRLRDTNWDDEFKKFGYGYLLNNVKKICYASSHKIDDKIDLLVLDEAHNITELRTEIFTNKPTSILCLTATPPTNKIKIKLFKDNNIDKIIYHLPLDKAVEYGIVSPYKITVVECRLNSTDRNIKAGSKAHGYFQITEQANYDWLSKAIGKLMYQNTEQSKKSREAMIIKRVQFLKGSKTKLEIAKWIKENLFEKSKRNLIFAGNIEQAETLSDFTYHSKKKNDDDLNRFIKGDINELACVDALNEGHNLNSVDNALVVQCFSDPRVLTQRVGRLIRYKEGHQGHVYVICCINTRDEEWVKKSLESFNPLFIEYIRFENLKKHYVQRQNQDDMQEF